MRKYILISIIILLFGAPLWMYVYWRLLPSRQLNITVIDKTVSQFPAQEHISLFWILKNRKYVKENGEFYDPTTNYFGYFPEPNYQYSIKGLEGKSDSELSSLATQTDMAYFADCYGIFDYDLHHLPPQINSTKIYGGLSKEDIFFMQKIANAKKTLIAEFNCMNSPSPVEFKQAFQQLFSVRWTGWVGKYYDDLSADNPELPQWVVKEYQRIQRKSWPYKGEGILLIHDKGKFIVLLDRLHLQGSMPQILTERKYQKYYRLPKSINYPFWFEIDQTTRRNDVISVIKLPTTQSGDSLLVNNNILKVFPVTVRNQIKGKNMYYFCADFADNPINYDLARFGKLEWLKKMAGNGQSKTKREQFFFQYYLPLMTKIMSDHERRISRNSTN